MDEIRGCGCEGAASGSNGAATAPNLAGLVPKSGRLMGAQGGDRSPCHWLADATSQSFRASTTLLEGMASC